MNETQQAAHLLRRAGFGATIAELEQALNELESDPGIGAIVVTGSEKAFAAGADIKEMQGRAYPEVYFEDFITARWEVVPTIKKPVIAAVAGFAEDELKIDVKEQGDAYKVHAELPGVRKEDIHVNIDGSIVSISAERNQEKEVKEGERVLRTERYFGKVSRSFQLGQDIDDGKAAAKFADGVLELTLPKKAAAQSKRLVID